MYRVTGNDPSARWAEAKYPEDATHECGEAAEGAYPLVFRSELAEKLGVEPSEAQPVEQPAVGARPMGIENRLS